MPAPPRFLNSVYETYPDTDSTKEVYLEAAGQTYAGYGDRHVLLWWINGVNLDTGNMVRQVIQLTGQAGNYAYYSPHAEFCSKEVFEGNTQLLVGQFSLQQRAHTPRLANGTVYAKRSVTNGCRVWTRDLLESCVKEGLVDRSYLS